MNIQKHIAKADRIEATRNRLDAEADYETFIWASMHVCTHWLNAALHAKGITAEDWDISHSYGLDDHPDQAALRAKLDEGFRSAMRELIKIETGIRYTHVRGPGLYAPSVTDMTREVFEGVTRFCRRTVADCAR